MNKISFLLSSASPWWILVCIAVGCGYAYLLYNKASFDKRTRRILAILRGTLVFLLSFLLLTPLLRTIGRTLEKPIIIVAQDNSSSVLATKNSAYYKTEYTKQLNNVIDDLSAAYTIKYYHFGAQLEEAKDLDFSEKRTDISEVFDEINDAYSNQNVGAVILASDGIYNKGSNPLYNSDLLNAPVYTIALGDTIPQKDLLIKNINYNRIVYLDNNFNINILVSAYGSKGERSRMNVSANGRNLFSKEMTIDKDQFFVEVPVTLNANKKGIQKYTISLSPVKNEITAKNNSQAIFIEVLEGKQKILLLANAPHPDLSAIKQSIESNKNYEVKLVLADAFAPDQMKNYQLVILHQLPASENAVQNIIAQLNAQNIPAWFIVGNQTYIDMFNRAGSGLTITGARNSYNEALPALSNDFFLFTLSEEAKKEIQKFPPLYSPFGQYNSSGDFSALLLQKIGNVTTNAPLLTFNNSGTVKRAILCGEGIWRWRLQNFASVQNHDALNELMSKSIQYLSTKDDKRKFRVIQPQNNFDENEDILFNAELYNDSYELVNDPDVTLELKSGNKKYNYTFSKTSNAYYLNAAALPVGDYSYIAKTSLGKENHTATGQFTVAELNVEEQQTTADHQLLFSIANRTGGQMLYPDQMGELEKLLKAREDIKSISYEQKKMEELIDLKWFFFLLLALISVEWFIRKRSGSY
jgi:hypothetical protein